MSGTTDAFARIRIDASLRDAGGTRNDGVRVPFEKFIQMARGPGDRSGPPIAAIETRCASTDLISAQDQGWLYVVRLGVRSVLRSNDEDVWCLNRETDLHAREVAGFWSQVDLERRIAARRFRRDMLGLAIDPRVVGPAYLR